MVPIKVSIFFQKFISRLCFDKHLLLLCLQYIFYIEETNMFISFQKQAYDKEKPMLLAKINKLESLCRAMQAERLGRKVLEASGMG
jgi:hypothetical protein